MTKIILETPLPVQFTEEMPTPTAETGPTEEAQTERPARLLEAGEYPDKSLTLTESDLDAIAARFSAAGEAVPVKIEHLDSPLDPLGQVVRVWREGAALLGLLAFPADLAGFLRRRGAEKLSVGLSRDPLALREVSLVLKPRVASAALMSGEPHSLSGTGGSQIGAEIGRLRAELIRRDVDAQVAAFRAQGRLVPAAEGAARALLAMGETLVTLSSGPEPVASVFKRFLEDMPPVVTFGEAALFGEAAGEAGADGFTHYEHTFLSKRLGVDPAKVAALIKREKETARGKENDHAY